MSGIRQLSTSNNMFLFISRPREFLFPTQHFGCFGRTALRRRQRGDSFRATTAMVDEARNHRKAPPYASAAAMAINQRERNNASATTRPRASKTEEPAAPTSASQRGKKVSALM